MLTLAYGVFEEIVRADEYPVEADGSQTRSEFFDEYTHHVADPSKPWPYFDIPGCLRVLPLSVDECYGRITSQWMTERGLTRHAVVQLALYACGPFRDVLPPGYPRADVTEGYIIDQDTLKNNDRKPRKYLCRVRSLVEALATELMYYESSCEKLDLWPSFQIEQDRCIRFLESFLWLRKNASQRGFAPKNPVLWHNRKLPVNIRSVIQAVESFTYDDYQHANAPTNKPGDPRAHGNKYFLLSLMKKAFSTHMPPEWRQEATHRALAAIMNQLKITNAQGKKWNANTIRRFLARGPDSRLSFTIHQTRPNVVPWYTRPE